MSDCVFCPTNWPNLDIVERHEERDYSIAVINPLNPVTEGHVLVISEPHTESAAFSNDSFPAMMSVAAGYVRRHNIQANIITSIGPDATQTVLHTHVHVVPRHPGDGLHLPWTGQWTYTPSCPCRRCEQHRADNQLTVNRYPFGLSEQNTELHYGH